MSSTSLETWLKATRFSKSVAVLRHQENESIRKGSDWDIAVRDPIVSGRELEAACGNPDMLIRRRYVEQRFYAWNQVDFLPRFEWNGIPFLDQDRFWRKVAIDGSNLPRPCIAHDAYLAWITGVLGGGVYKDRYNQLLSDACRDDRDEFVDCLREAFGHLWAEELIGLAEAGKAAEASKYKSNLRFMLMIRRFFIEPGPTGLGLLRHWWRELYLHFNPPFPWIAFLGPDGSGKSTIIQHVKDRLRQRRLDIKMLHWCPALIRKRPAVIGGIVTNPHGKPPRGRLASLLKLVMLVCDWSLASIWSLRHPRAKNRLLLSDRYFDDLLVDPLRYRYGAPIFLAENLFRFLPRPDRVILLVGDPATIHARKNEVSLDEMVRQMSGYRKLGQKIGKRAIMIDATKPIDEVVNQAYSAIITSLGE